MRYFGTCEYCGGETSAYYKSQLKRFCSHSCSNQYKWKYSRPRAEKEKVNCAECGKEFEIQKCDHRIKEGQKNFFCSLDCSIAFSKHPQRQNSCLVCGKPFWRGRSKHKLCSQDCSNMHKRFLAYKRLYDPNIELDAFVLLYKEENPFAWASDKKRYLKRYNNANRERLNWQKLLHKHSSELNEFKIFMRQRIQACYKEKRKFSYALQGIVGCNITEFRRHIASQFQEGMSEANYGEWHLDHIIPLASASSIEEVERLSHYTNYQPLWAEDNLRKSDNLPAGYEKMMLAFNGIAITEV